MTRSKRICSAGAFLFVIVLPILLSAHAAASQGTFQTKSYTTTAEILHSAQLPAMTSEALHITSYTGEIPLIIAQEEIPNVLTPSLVPTAEPSLFAPTPSVQPSATVSNSSSAAGGGTGNSMSLDKIIGNISPSFIIALIPLLFVIAALFYFFFMGDHYSGAPDEDQQTEVELSEVEDGGWRQL
jgi:hypothetical protein